MNDLISRQDAIITSLEFFVEYLGGAFDENSQKELMARLQRLPSEEPEIIRCKDCKYYFLGSDGIPFCFKHDVDMLWQDNDFCSKSERRTDE